jgi:hypothetical protein
LALADTYLGSLSLSSFGSRRPLALTMAGSSGCGGPRATPPRPVWVIRVNFGVSGYVRSRGNLGSTGTLVLCNVGVSRPDMTGAMTVLATVVGPLAVLGAYR